MVYGLWFMALFLHSYTHSNCIFKGDLQVFTSTTTHTDGNRNDNPATSPPTPLSKNIKPPNHRFCYRRCSFLRGLGKRLQSELLPPTPPPPDTQIVRIFQPGALSSAGSLASSALWRTVPSVTTCSQGFRKHFGLLLVWEAVGYHTFFPGPWFSGRWSQGLL
jgi:hypothetical protein